MVAHTPPSESEDLGHKLNLIYFSNEFPSDDLSYLLRRLHGHSKLRNHSILARFLHEATRELRQVSQLRADLARRVPAFESVTSLAGESDLCKGPLCGSIDGVLLCVLQLATYTDHCECFPEAQSSAGSNSLLAGLGIGLLVSTAVSLSISLDDLVASGIEVLHIEFRLGVHVSDVSQNLEAIDAEASDSWAYVVYGLTPEDAQKELDNIHTRDSTPAASRVFVSAISETSVTLSGPPSRLKALFRTSGFFWDRKFTQLPVYEGLCHAAHTYTHEDAQQVVQAPLLAPRFKSVLPVMSTSTGQPFVASSAADLFEQVIFEILTKQIVWDNVVRGVVERATKTDAHDVNIMVFRVSLPIQQISTALTTTTPDLAVEAEDLFLWMTTDAEQEKHEPRGSIQSKIAIDGMSCYMPGGATDTDKFWELLESGMDVH